MRAFSPSVPKACSFSKTLWIYLLSDRLICPDPGFLVSTRSNWCPPIYFFHCVHVLHDIVAVLIKLQVKIRLTWRVQTEGKVGMEVPSPVPIVATPTESFSYPVPVLYVPTELFSFSTRFRSQIFIYLIFHAPTEYLPFLFLIVYAPSECLPSLFPSVDIPIECL